MTDSRENKAKQPIKNDCFPKEGLTDSMAIRDRNSFRVLYRPNNYRRQIRVRYYFENFHGKLKAVSIFSNAKISEKKIIYIKDYRDRVNIELAKVTLSAYYNQYQLDGHKEVYLIERSTQVEIDTRIQQIKNEIKDKLDLALRDFIREFNLSMEGITFNPAWRQSEDWIKEEDYIAKLPKEMIIHDKLFKKVYADGIEFYGNQQKQPTESARNFIHNLSIKKVSPEICEELQAINDKLEKPKQSDYDFLKECIAECESIQKTIAKIYDKTRSYRLTDLERKQLELDLIDRYGVKII